MAITATTFGDSLMLKMVSEAGPITLLTANLNTYAVTSSYLTTEQQRILSARLQWLDGLMGGGLSSNGVTGVLSLLALFPFQQNIVASASVASGVATVTLTGFLNDASAEYVQVSLPHSYGSPFAGSAAAPL